MIKPKDLRDIADNKKHVEGNEFVSKIIPEIEELMNARAKNGEYELDVRGIHLLNGNFSNWLTKPHLYKPVIAKLEKEGFKVSHSDDTRDGIYIIIRW